MIQPNLKRSIALPLCLLLQANFCAATEEPFQVVDIRKESDFNYSVTAPTHQLSYLPATDTSIDTLWTLNPATQKSQQILARMSPIPEKLDQQPIFRSRQLAAPTEYTGPDLRELIGRAGLEELLCNMPDGYYYFAVPVLIIDSAGYIAHCEVQLPQRRSPEYSNWPDGADPGGMTTEAAKEQLLRRLAAVMISQNLQLGRDASGNKVPYILDNIQRPDNKNKTWPLAAFFTVKDHRLTYSR